MDNGPYNIKGSLLVVKPWPPKLAFEEVDLSSCAFCVQVHGLPLQNIMVVNAIKIGKLIGLKVLTVEDGDKSGIINHHHLRFRLLIDVSLPLAPGFHLPCSGRSPLWIKLIYERLANYCALCGCIGHCKTFCPAPPPLGTPDRYSTSLRGYVYPSSRKLVYARPASGTNEHTINPMPSCSVDTGSVLYLQGVSSASAASPINGLPPSLVPFKLAEEASLPTESRPQSPSCSYTHFFGQCAATSPHVRPFASSKGKEKKSGFLPMDSSESMVLGQDPILGHDPSTDPLFKLGLYSTRPTVYGPHDQHNSRHRN